MASRPRQIRAAGATEPERRYATALLQISSPPRAVNDNVRIGHRRHRLLPLLAAIAVAAAALWSFLG